MARFLKTKKEHIGLSPETPYFRGEKKSDQVLLRLMNISSNSIDEIQLENIDQIPDLLVQSKLAWLNIDGLHDSKVMADLARVCNLNYLIIPDVLDTHARPKFHQYDDCLFLSLKMLKYDEVENEINSENISIVVKQNIIISFQEKEGDVFEPLRSRIRKMTANNRYHEPGYLSFAILDIIFDNYKYVLSQIGERIEASDIKLIDDIDVELLAEINDNKKEMIYLKKSIFPCQEIVSDLIKTDSFFINKKNLNHFKELRTNLQQSIETIESYREILSDQINVYHNTMSSKLNDIIKFLTVFSTIFIPLTLITGIYGTNFDVIPELHFAYSYPLMWLAMIIVSLLMIMYFRRKNWL